MGSRKPKTKSVTAPRRTRTYLPLIKSQTKETRKACSQNDLRIATPDVSHPIPTDTCKNDPDLATVIEAWDRLPEAIRAGILAMVKASENRLR
jgi:hypothetical protein